MSDTLSVVAITGPTASGKTSLAVKLAKALDGEIISADSVQIYKDANIGSAKPTAEEQAGIPHHLLSVLSPDEEFDASEFCRLAGAAIVDISSRKRVPIVAGGTGLYLRALFGGLVEVPEISHDARDLLDNRERDLTARLSEGDSVVGKLHEWLSELDPYTASSIRPEDSARVRRALLVTLSSGASLRALQEAHAHSDRRYHGLVCCMLPPREDLYRAIDRRVDGMLAAGLEQEVRMLSRAHGTSKLLRTIGYRHMRDHLGGLSTKEQMVAELKQDTRRFAKRQLTWWRHQPSVLGWKSLPAGGTVSLSALVELSEKFLNNSGEFSESQVFFFPFEGVCL